MNDYINGEESQFSPDNSAFVPDSLIMELPFTDLYMAISKQHSKMPVRFRPDPTRTQLTGNYIVPKKYQPSMDAIRNLIISRPEDDGTVQYSGLRLRYSRFWAAEDMHWAAIRAVPLDLPELEALGIHPQLLREIQGWGRKRGLVIIGGGTGNGKTTTAVGLIKYYLQNYGGLAITCEDPVEYQLQGAISDKGYCFQTEIRNEDDWSTSIRGIMRRRPEYIMIGEVRSPEAAEQLLKAATSGHLVITTIHAASAADTIQAILHLAENKLGPVAKSIIADRLVGILHQTLRMDGPHIDSIIPIKMNEQQIKGTILNGDIGALNENHVKPFKPISHQ